MFLLRNNKSYQFRGKRGLEELTEFAESGWEQNAEEFIFNLPKRVEGLEKI